MDQKLGAVPLWEGELGPHLTQCGQGRGLPACQVSSWSIQSFGHSTPTSQTGQTGQDRTDRQRSDSIGRTVSQTVVQKTVRSMLFVVSVLSCLSVTLVHCGQTVGWIKMKL